jgi:DNA polymerase-3 subunit alpha (Gram-positive type)
MNKYCIIPDNCQNFWSFVDKLAVPKEHKSLLQHCKISRVDVDIQTSSWVVYVDVPKPVPAELFHLASMALCEFCGLVQVNFIPNIKDLRQFLAEHWQQFVNLIAGSNQTIVSVLGNASWNFDGHTLTIETSGELSSEMLISRGVAKRVQHILLREFDHNCNVEFISNNIECEALCEDD